MTLASLARRCSRFAEIVRHKARVARIPHRGPKLSWEPMPDGPIARVEPSCVRLGERLHVIGGYHTVEQVAPFIDVFDLVACRWAGRRELPPSIPQTHCGVVGEGDRHIHFVAGQVGARCAPATNECRSLDVVTGAWTPLPPLPEPRYAPVTQLWRGRLHVLGGSKPDRCTPAAEHWSLAVRDGRALEPAWRAEPEIPLGGPHRASAVADDTLFVLGSLHFDRPRIPGDPLFSCDWGARPEAIFGHCFALDHGAARWRAIAGLPIAVSHTEYSTFAENGKIVVLGGVMPGMLYCDLVQAYDIATDRWSVAGRLPSPNKGFAHARHDGWLHVCAGQANAGPLDLTFGPILASGARARFTI